MNTSKAMVQKRIEVPAPTQLASQDLSAKNRYEQHREKRYTVR
jgi:hypothetical protein